LSLAPGETVEGNKLAKFVVPNEEIRKLIENRLMDPFYEQILKNKCMPFYRCIIAESAGTDKFMQNLNENCLTNIPYSEHNLVTEAYFESVILGIFTIAPSDIYYVDVQNDLNRQKLSYAFYPG